MSSALIHMLICMLTFSSAFAGVRVCSERGLTWESHGEDVCAETSPCEESERDPCDHSLGVLDCLDLQVEALPSLHPHARQPVRMWVMMPRVELFTAPQARACRNDVHVAFSRPQGSRASPPCVRLI
jgi:hypothetical protein